MIKCGPHGCLSLCKTQRMLKGQVVQELQSDVCWVSGLSLATLRNDHAGSDAHGNRRMRWFVAQRMKMGNRTQGNRTRESHSN